MSSCNHAQCETPFCPWCGKRVDPEFTGRELLNYCKAQIHEFRSDEIPLRGLERKNETFTRFVQWIEKQLQRNREAGR